MAKPKEPLNPFYVLSGIFGAAFTLTACAFGVLLLQTTRRPNYGNESGHPLMNLLDRHGLAILAVEVILLGIVSVAAIGLDHFRNKRLAQQIREQSSKPSLAENSFKTPDDQAPDTRHLSHPQDSS